MLAYIFSYFLPKKNCKLAYTMCLVMRLTQEIVTFMSRAEGVIGKWGPRAWQIYFPPKGRSVAQRNVGPMAENTFFMPEGETHFPMTPEARLKNDNLTGMLEFVNIN